MTGARVSAPTASGLAYVSLPPGNDALGETVTVHNVSSGTSVTAAMANGGFDPVAIAARAGDTLQVTLRESTGDGSTGYAFVPRISAPVVVRTVPLGGATGVVVEDTILAVFSEPMDGPSLAVGLELQDAAGALVSATELTSGCEDGLCARLVPDAVLAGHSTYGIRIFPTVRSRAGLYIAGPYQAQFTTGDWATRPPTLVVDSFTVMEYHLPGDTVNWYYAPQLTVSDTAGRTGASIEQFTLQIPGLDDVTMWPCTPVSVTHGQTANVFLDANGAFQLSYGQSGRRASAGDATGVLSYVDGGYRSTQEMHARIVTADAPVTNIARPGNWDPYCDY